MSTQHHPFSPSKLELFFRCPASFQAIQELLGRGVPKLSGEAAERGTLIHSAIAQQNPELVKDSDKFIVEHCISVMDGIVGEKETEVKVSLKDENGEELIFGTLDFVAETENAATLIDWKTGYAPVETEGNLQLKAYAAALMQERPYLKKVYCFIVQPTVSKTLPEPMVVEACYVQKVISGIKYIKEKCLATNPEKKCGEHCRYCEAVSVCELAVPFVMRKALEMFGNTEQSVKEPEMFAESLACCDGVETILKGVLDRIKQIRDIAKFNIESGMLVPGWFLKRGNKTRGIYNEKNNIVYGLAREFGIDERKFMEFVEISPAKFINYLARLKDESGNFVVEGKKLEDREKAVEERLKESGALYYTYNQQSLKKGE